MDSAEMSFHMILIHRPRHTSDDLFILTAALMGSLR